MLRAGLISPALIFGALDPQILAGRRRSLTSKQLEPSVANGHMTQEERRELIRAQREVITNLQKDYVVTVVRPGDEPVPYKRQGNPAVNTPNSVRQRLALKKKPLIQVCFLFGLKSRPCFFSSESTDGKFDGSVNCDDLSCEGPLCRENKGVMGKCWRIAFVMYVNGL